LFAFVLSLPAAVGAFFRARTLIALCRDSGGKERWAYAILAFVVGITASGPVSLLGTTTNDWPGAALIMLALWMLLDRAAPWHPIAVAGLLAGVASGLKLTNAPYAVGLCVALLLAPASRSRRLWDAILFGVAVLAAERSLGDAMRNGDKSAARRLLSLQFTYADENGKVYERKAFLDDLKGAAATDVKVKIYGLVAMVTGGGTHRGAHLDHRQADEELAPQTPVLGLACGGANSGEERERAVHRVGWLDANAMCGLYPTPGGMSGRHHGGRPGFLLW